jgi:hypothetical protein
MNAYDMAVGKPLVARGSHGVTAERESQAVNPSDTAEPQA